MKHAIDHTRSLARKLDRGLYFSSYYSALIETPPGQKTNLFDACPCKKCGTFLSPQFWGQDCPGRKPLRGPSDISILLVFVGITLIVGWLGLSMVLGLPPW